jgi:hypothetical protein
MHVPTRRPLNDSEIAEVLLSLGRKLLYVLLFVILLFARWDLPFSFGYVGAIVIFVFLGLYYLKDEFWKEEEEIVPVIDARTAILMYKPKNDEEEEKERE